MTLPSELQSALPASIAPEVVREAVRVPGSRGALGGESWLVELDAGLALLCRASIFDPLAPVDLATDGDAAIQASSDGFSTRLEVRCADGESFTLRASSREAEQIRALLERVRATAPLSTEPTPVEPPAPAPAPAPAPPPAPAPAPVEPPTSEPAASFEELVRALEAGAIERAERITRRLANDDPARTRPIAERARDHFVERLAAAPGDLGPMRALARLHLELDELDAALDLTRSAIELEPEHYDTRMLEAEILAQQAMVTGDWEDAISTLEVVAAEFPDRARPLVELADIHEFDEPQRAITCLHQALQREFDPRTVASLVELFDVQKRYHQVIELLEDTLARRDSSRPWPNEDELREKLIATRVRLGIRPETAAVIVADQTELDAARQRARSAMLIVVLVAIGMLAMLLLS